MTLRVRLAGYQGEASVHTRAMHELAGRLSDAGFDVVFTPDITLDGNRAADLLSLTEDGDLEICYFSASYLADRVPEIRCLDTPFLFQDRASAHLALDGDLCATIETKLEDKSDFHVLGWWDNGFRHFTSGARAIRSPADCIGQRLRTMGAAPQHEKLFATIGFTPVPLDVRELVPAIAESRVDAQENPLTNIWNFGLQNYHQWITLSGHLFGASCLLCNKHFFSGLPEDVRHEVVKAAAAATTLQRELAAADDIEIAEKLAAADVELIELSPSERDEFVARVRPLVLKTTASFPKVAEWLRI
ncbi:MAG: TRAP transporter substrate-binding protein [Gammaproteobacteria bacterium]